MHFRITKLYKPFCIRFSFLNLMLLHLQIFYPSTSNLILLQNHLYPALAFGTTLTLVKSRQWDKSRKWDDCGWLANFVNYAVISENSSATLPPYDTSLIARNICPPSFLSYCLWLVELPQSDNSFSAFSTCIISKNQSSTS